MGREPTFPLEVVKKLGQLGYMGSIFPEEYGGAGLGYVEYSIIIEELSRVDGSVGIIVAAHTSLCSNHIYKAGTEEQKQKYLMPRLTTGEWIGSWSLTEPEAGSDAAGTRSTAVRDGEDWVLNGSKTFTTNAPLRRCLRGDGGDGSRGGAAWHLCISAGERHARFPLRQEGKQDGDARQCHGRSHLQRLPPSPDTHRLGELNQGFVDSLRILDGGRVSISALSIGMAQGAYDAALKYSKMRKQFGRPSRNSRPFNTSWWIWRPRSMPRGC